jgi:hypothetical protein
MRWFASLPVLPLALIAVFLGLAPFTPEPHLWEKLKMLAAGELVRPVDVLDLVMHGGPAILLMVNLWLRRKG